MNKTDPILNILPTDHQQASLVGRVLRPGLGASVVVVRDGDVFDITPATPTMSELFDKTNPVALARTEEGEPLGSVEALAAASVDKINRCI